MKEGERKKNKERGQEKKSEKIETTKVRERERERDCFEENNFFSSAITFTENECFSLHFILYSPNIVGVEARG